MNMITDSGDANTRTSMAIRQRVTDRFLRMELLQVSGMRSDAGSAEGTYTVYDAVDSTVTMVMTNQKMATVMSLTPIANMSPPSFQTHSDGSTQFEDLGAGDAILGHATRHYRTSVHGKMEFTLGGHSCSKPLNTVTDAWYAPDVDLMPIVHAVLKHFGPAFERIGAAPGMDQSGNAAPPAGTPLRSITSSIYSDPNGQSHTIRTTVEYVEINHAPIDGSAFVVPSEFKVMDMRAEMAKLAERAGTQQTMDSSRASAVWHIAETMCK
jgi:hypothetical protein